ncbi:MAG: response regulator [Vicinamibacterales bacterium]
MGPARSLEPRLEGFSRISIMICDDDASTRFALKRLLTRHVDCVVVECSDGSEVLAHLDVEPVDLLLLDIEMPTLSGAEVVTALRASDRYRHLPVIMMSRERRETVVRTLVRLGIDGYVLKPLHAEKMLAALEPLRQRLASPYRLPCAGASTAAGGAAASVMVVHGSADYRRLFVEKAASIGPVIQAESGAAALATYPRAQTPLVFIGTDLGVIGRERLAQRLRAHPVAAPQRIVALSDPSHASIEGVAACDEELEQCCDPDVLERRLHRFARIAGPMGARGVLVGELEDCLVDSGRQVCAMLLDTSVAVTHRTWPPDPSGVIYVAIEVEHQPVLDLSLRMTVDGAAQIASSMFGKAKDQISDEDRETAVTELTNMVGMRVRELLQQRSIRAECARARADWAPTELHDVPAGRICVRLDAIETPLLVELRLDPVTPD